MPFTFEQAIDHLIENFNTYPVDFKNKYKPYISRYRSGKTGSGVSVSDNKMREILTAADYQGEQKEKWIKVKPVKRKIKRK